MGKAANSGAWPWRYSLNASASLNSSGVGSYLYNGLEQRVQKVAGGTTTQFVYDEVGHLIQEANSAGVVQKEYIWLDDLPVAMVDDTGASPAMYFIHTDQIGTPQKITDTSAAIVWDGTFDPFGSQAPGTGGAAWGTSNWGSFNWGASAPSLALTNLRFPGQYTDAETGLNQNWARDYDTTLGRYLQSDPTGLLGGTNTYAYVGSSPLLLIDPSGLLTWINHAPARTYDLKTGQVFRVLPLNNASPTKENALAATIPTLSIAAHCECTGSGTYKLSQYEVNYAPEVHVRPNLSGPVLKAALRAEGNHVTDFRNWANNTGRGTAQALENRYRGNRFVFRTLQECESALRASLLNALDSSLHDALNDTISRWDLSGAHTWGGPYQER